MIPVFILALKSKVYIFTVGATLAFVSFIELFYAFVFKGELSKTIFFVIFNTNVGESREFYNDYMTMEVFWMTSLFIGLFIVSTSFIWKKKYVRLSISKKILALFVLAPLSLKSYSYNWRMDRVLDTYARSNSLLRFGLSLNEYFSDIKMIKVNSKKEIPFKSSIKRISQVEGNETHILVIGEATTSTKMSLYGYHRKTNPYLESIRDELKVFLNVQASTPPVTDVNVTRMLTLMNSSTKDKKLINFSIIKIMREAGFKTYWLSNQGNLGHKITIITAVGMASEIKNYTSSGTAYNKDDRVFSTLERYLTQDSVPKKFIIIHLNGAHNTYSHRYPSNFNKFKSYEDIPKKDFHTVKKMNLINEYDNAILYNDWIVFKILNKLKNVRGNKSLVYIPDHGEEVYDTLDRFGHGGAIPTKGIYKIPFVVWLDEQYAKVNKDLIFDVERNYRSDHLIHSLLNLYRVDYRLYDAKQSLFSKQFIPSQILNFN